jgi:hypothetical protein
VDYGVWLATERPKTGQIEFAAARLGASLSKVNFVIKQQLAKAASAASC